MPSTSSEKQPHKVAAVLAPSRIVDCVREHLKDFLPGHPLDHWLASRFDRKYEPFYASIDVRDAGFKLAPVDANLYPAGFNNICEDDLATAPAILKAHLERRLGFIPKRVAILPEAHTKNRYYLDNIIELRKLFINAGIACEIGWFDHATISAPEFSSSFELQSTAETITVHPFRRVGDRLAFKPFDPDFIVVNNDFSSGYPAELEGISQPLEPSPKMGWHTRRKSDFFTHYNRVAAELSKEAGIDPWCLQVDTRLVTGVDFDANEGMEKIAAAVDDLIASLKKEYAERKIDEKPFVFVKSNSGTYGMGILKVESGAELLSLNRRERNKMAVVKNKLEVHEVIVQEGIPTRFQLEGVTSEPTIYMLGSEVIGGFLRTNPTRSKSENLNSAGMVFKKLCVSDLRDAAFAGEIGEEHTLELVYGTIARLSAAAMGIELKALMERGH